jgi:DNA-binding LacI/PurR family transcriptional regulator
MAIVAMHALRSTGLRVPEDLSVIGFGGWPLAERLADPPLSTVRVPFRETGRCAVRMVLDLISRGQCEPRQLVLAPELCVRASTARLRTR